MVKIAEITDQNRWWSQGGDFPLTLAYFAVAAAKAETLSHKGRVRCLRSHPVDIGHLSMDGNEDSIWAGRNY